MSAPASPGLFATLRHDVRQTMADARQIGYGRTVSHSVVDLEDYYLSPSDRLRLASMNAFRRFFARAWWLFKALFFKLGPGRRVLLAFGLVAMLIMGVS